MKTRKLPFEPVSVDEFAEAVAGLSALSDADKKALIERYRRSRMSPEENALRAIFGGLFDTARMLSAQEIVPYTTDEQIVAERAFTARWNDAAARAGWDVRIEQFGAANNGGIRFIVGDVSTIKLRRGEWLSDTFALLWLTGENGSVDPVEFGKQSRHQWEGRLRQRVGGKAFADFALDRDRAISLEDNQRKERARDIRRRAKNLDAHLAANGVDALVPANWPTKDGVTPISKPHEARNEIVIGKDGKKTSLFVESAVQRLIWSHRGWWNFREWSGHRLDPTPALKLLYLQRRKLLPTPRLQQLMRRWRRLKIECGDNSNKPNNRTLGRGRRPFGDT